jgi:hypothetical protein
MSRLFLPAALVAVAVLALPGAAHAITPGLGQLKAVSNGTTVPPGSRIAITPDETDGVVGTAPAYIAARKAAAEALRGLGLTPDDNGKLTLKIEVGTPHFDTHRNGDETARSDVSADITQQLGPSRKARVVNQFEVPFEEPESQAQPGLSLALFLTDERGRPLWTATFQAGGRVADAEAMIRRMTRAAVASLGAQVERDYVLACETQEQAQNAGTCLP